MTLVKYYVPDKNGGAYDDFVWRKTNNIKTLGIIAYRNLTEIIVEVDEDTAIYLSLKYRSKITQYEDDA